MSDEALAGLACLHADDDLLVLDKPPGLLCVPGRGPDKQDCLSTRAQALWSDALIVHRLDQPTSGLVLMARGLPMQRALSRIFAERRVHKRYQAVVAGLPQPDDTADDEGWSAIALPIAADWERRPLRVVMHRAASPASRAGGCWTSTGLWAARAWSSNPSPAARTSCACIWRRWATRYSATCSTPTPRNRQARRACCCTPARWNLPIPCMGAGAATSRQRHFENAARLTVTMQG